MAWLFRWQRDGQVKEITLAGAETSLADARNLAATARMAVKAGKPPSATQGSPTGGKTLGEAVEDWIGVARHGWRSLTEEGHSRNQLQHHFGHLYDRPIANLAKADMLAVLQGVWGTGQPWPTDSFPASVRCCGAVWPST